MTIFIPQKLRVGFQEREDCYTGKLAYVIYYDKLGKIRKEASWKSWRDEAIESLECDNEPTEGFVLNKKAGDYKSDWNHRKAYSRVYDPRGFEIEINVDNLLFILENCTSSPGKALGGDFVYAFDGKDLLLLPTNCPDYKEHKSFSELKERKINPKKIKVGHEYLDKSNTKYIALGKCRWHGGNSYRNNKSGEVFYNTEKEEFDRNEHNFIWESEGPSELLDGLITEFSESESGSARVQLVVRPHEYNDSYYSTRQSIKCIEDYFEVRLYDRTGKESQHYIKFKIEDGEVVKEYVDLVKWEQNKYSSYYGWGEKKIIEDLRGQISGEEHKKLVTKLFVILSSGEEIECPM